MPGINAGLPFTYHWDEPFVVHPALEMIRTGNLVPQYWHYPHLFIYSEFAALAVTFPFLRTEATPYSIQTYYQNVSPWLTPHPYFLTVSRSVALVFGLILVVQLALWGKRWSGYHAGLLIGLLAAVSPLLAVHSTRALGDLPACVFVLACLQASLRAMRQKRCEWWILAAGVFAGLAAGTKYSNYIALTMPLAALAFHPTRLRMISWVWLVPVLGFGLAFTLSTPGLLLYLPDFLHHLSVQMRRFVPADGEGGLGARWQQVFGVLHNGWGWVLLVACSVAAALWMRDALECLRSPLGRKLGLREQQRCREAWVLALALACFLKGLLGYANFFERYALPMVVLMIAGTAYGLGRCLSGRPPMTKSVLAGGIALLILLSAWPQFIAQRRAWQVPDSRLEALRWIEQNLPKETVLGVCGELGYPPGSLSGSPKHLFGSRMMLLTSAAQRPEMMYLLGYRSADLSPGGAGMAFKGAIERLNAQSPDPVIWREVRTWGDSSLILNAPCENPGVILYERVAGAPEGAGALEPPAIGALSYSALESVEPRAYSVNSLPGVTLVGYGKLLIHAKLPREISGGKLHAVALVRSDSWPHVSVAVIAASGQTFRTQPFVVTEGGVYARGLDFDLKVPPGDYMVEISYFGASPENPVSRPILHIAGVEFR